MAAQRISIGFQASPPVALRVAEEELGKLREALGGDGWYELQAEDGTLKMNLAHVLWVKTDREEQRVGFGLST
jgi:hypothetical protein